MSVLLKAARDAYVYARDDLKDPRTADWFMVHSPVPIFFVGVVYLCLVTEWIPRCMRRRRAFDLRATMMAYDVLQIVLNGYVLFKGVPSLHSLEIRCAVVKYTEDYDALNFARLTWLYFMIKLLDMVDTIFLALRKKNRRVSFLHTYHHFGMVFVAWVGTKYLAGGESIYLGFVNAVVHVVLYGYYLFAAWKPEETKLLEKFKIHVTQLQLLQFVILFVNYTVKLVTNCAYPKLALCFIIPQTMTMMVMFGDFYYRTYIRRSNL